MEGVFHEEIFVFQWLLLFSTGLYREQNPRKKKKNAFNLYTCWFLYSVDYDINCYIIIAASHFQGAEQYFFLPAAGEIHVSPVFKKVLSVCMSKFRFTIKFQENFMLSKKKNNWYALAFPAILLVFSILACDSGGSDKKTPPDTTAPAMIELDSLSAETTTITFTWNDPADSDFDHLEVTCLGATETVAAGTQACTITGLSADTRYEVSAASADTTGNVSEAVVFSVTTPAAGSIAYSILYTEDELDNVRNNLSGNYFLMVDLDLSSYESWTPLGDVSTAFTGVFHGNGHTISHLTITGSDDRQGLFGNVTGGEITGLGLIEVNVSGDDSVGGLVGYTYGYSTISDCYATGTVTGSSDNVGGLVGSSYTVIVSGCYAACEVNGSSYVGGLMGRSSNGGTISDCYASGGVTGSSYTGGLVGIISNNSTVNSTVVSNCYATGSVEGSSSVGGLVGWLYSSCTYPPGCTPMGCIVSGCYATGAVTGFSNVGGLVGDNEGYNEIYDCYTAAMPRARWKDLLMSAGSWEVIIPLPLFQTAFTTVKQAVTIMPEEALLQDGQRKEQPKPRLICKQ